MAYNFFLLSHLHYYSSKETFKMVKKSGVTFFESQHPENKFIYGLPQETYWELRNYVLSRQQNSTNFGSFYEKLQWGISLSVNFVLTFAEF